MQILRTSLLACVLLAFAPLTAHAQQAIAGSTFYFDHDGVDTEKYQLCVDAVTDTACQDIGVTKVGTSQTYSFTLPAWVPRGNRALSVRAIGLLDTGPSGPSNTLAVRVIGKPTPPVNMRQTEAQP